MASHAVFGAGSKIGAKDLSRFSKGAMLAVAAVLAGATIVAMARVLLGLTSPTYEVKQLAVLIHLSSVLPAIPLGLWVLMARKGDATHKLLGRIWGVLMLVAAGSAIFIRNLNHGQFSWIHLFVVLTVVTLYRGVRAARRGDIAAHKRHMWGMYAGALLLPGLFAFVPGRLLWHWLML